MEDLKGELAGVLEGFGRDFIESVSVFMPVGHVVEVTNEVKHGKIGAGHEWDVIVDDGTIVRRNPVGDPEGVGG